MSAIPTTPDHVIQLVQDCLNADASTAEKVRYLWSLLLQARGKVLTDELWRIVPHQVFKGPFAGMNIHFDNAFIESSLLLGSYEQELHTTIERIVQSSYQRIINIGCSLGYYAVGFARRMPSVQVDAFDIDEDCQKLCQSLAKQNGVDKRVSVEGLFDGIRFAAYDGFKTLAWIDIEGAEIELLNPERYPALKKMDVVVELHDNIDSTISRTISQRFASTHSVEIVMNKNYLPDIEGLFPDGTSLNLFDQALLGWEHRGGSTPWGIFRAN